MKTQSAASGLIKLDSRCGAHESEYELTGHLAEGPSWGGSQVIMGEGCQEKGGGSQKILGGGSRK